jgi:hypothetical protein
MWVLRHGLEKVNVRRRRCREDHWPRDDAKRAGGAGGCTHADTSSLLMLINSVFGMDGCQHCNIHSPSSLVAVKVASTHDFSPIVVLRVFNTSCFEHETYVLSPPLEGRAPVPQHPSSHVDFVKLAGSQGPFCNLRATLQTRQSRIHK